MNHTTKKIEVIIKSLADAIVDAEADDIQNILEEVKETLPYLGGDARKMLFLQTELDLRVRILADIHASYCADANDLSPQLVSWLETYQEHLNAAKDHGFLSAHEDWSQYANRRLCLGATFTLDPIWDVDEQKQAVSRVKSSRSHRMMTTAIEDTLIKLFLTETGIGNKLKRNIRLFLLMRERWDESQLYFFDLLSYENDKYCFTDIHKLVATGEINGLEAAHDLLRKLYQQIPADIYNRLIRDIAESHVQMTIASLLDYAQNGGIDIPVTTKSKMDLLHICMDYAEPYTTNVSSSLYDITRTYNLLRSNAAADIEKVSDHIMQVMTRADDHLKRLFSEVSVQVIHELCAAIYNEYELPEALEKNVAFDLAFCGGGPPLQI
ncbi:hypothetical protein LJC34_06215 [Oscillospiraceae bacterium OttesenSCG-928-G22]|nr:hypothetical protein [Oscillospiraceae bacterium OttesenSCG-928-G22]